MSLRFAVETADKKTFYVYASDMKAARRLANLYFNGYTLRLADERDEGHYQEDRRPGL